MSDIFRLALRKAITFFDTIKRAEDEQAWILRLHEYKNHRDKAVSLRFGLLTRKIVQPGLMENENGGAELLDKSLCFSIGCYEIKTFKVWF